MSHTRIETPLVPLSDLELDALEYHGCSSGTSTAPIVREAIVRACQELRQRRRCDVVLEIQRCIDCGEVLVPCDCQPLRLPARMPGRKVPGVPMIKVSSDVTIYEVDGNETSGVPMPTISVHSHWNRNSMVVLEVDGKRVTVVARDLRSAIDNATNTAG